jgi:hypothetical protein
LGRSVCSRPSVPEIEAWELEQYARILAAAKQEGPAIYAAVCLAGEAGLRVGEIKALRWREDVDMVAKTITVNQQMRRGIAGTPKGRTRRTVPMMVTLYEALRAMDVVREGYVVLDHIGRGETGRAKHEENVVKRLMERVCRKAGLPESGLHRLRRPIWGRLKRARFGSLYPDDAAIRGWRARRWRPAGAHPGHRLLRHTRARCWRRQHRERSEAIGTRAHDCGQLFVAATRERRCRDLIPEVDAGRRQREQRGLDVVRVAALDDLDLSLTVNRGIRQRDTTRNMVHGSTSRSETASRRGLVAAMDASISASSTTRSAGGANDAPRMASASADARSCSRSHSGR